MQQKFKSVSELIESLPRKEQVIMTRLRALILECLPRAVEKFTYGAPFYHGYRMICFIWPPSLYWGKPKDKEARAAKGVTLGFCQANKMADPDQVLQVEGRKQMYCLYFHALSEINDAQIRTLLFEAESVDEYFRKKGGKKKSGSPRR